MAVWYLASNKHALVPQWAASTAYVIGDFVRQLAAPSAGNERVWRAESNGTSGGSEPSWNLNKNTTTNDNGITWREVTGNATYGWSAAAARINIFMNGASSWNAAGDDIYMHSSHSETWSGTINLTSNGGSTTVNRFLSVNDAETALEAGATFTRVTGGATSITMAGTAFFHGWHLSNEVGNIQFIVGRYMFEDCEFTMGGASAILFGFNTTGLINRITEFRNCTTNFTHANSGFQIEGASFHYFGGAVTGTPTNLFRDVNQGPGGYVIVRDVDLSTIDDNLVVAQADTRIDYLFENCELNAAVTVSSSATVGIGGTNVRVVNCDSAGTNYNFHSIDWAGTITSESTIVLNAITSRKMVTTANGQFFQPLCLDEIVIYNALTGGALTATVEIVNDGVTLENDEVWMEVEYLGDSGSPQGFLVSTRLADPVFGTPAALDASTEAWVTTGLSSPVKQRMQAVFTPELEGVIKIRVYAARPSLTFYVDPQVLIS